MRKFLILTHGEFAQGVAQSLTLFLGENHPFTAISAYIDDEPVQLKIDQFMMGLAQEDQLIVLTDILGGSVNQCMIPYLSRPNTIIITGFNFPMLLELSCLPAQADMNDFRRIIQTGKDSVVLMNDYMSQIQAGEADE